MNPLSWTTSYWEKWPTFVLRAEVLSKSVMDQKRDIVDAFCHASRTFGHGAMLGLTFPYIWEMESKGQSMGKRTIWMMNTGPFWGSPFLIYGRWSRRASQWGERTIWMMNTGPFWTIMSRTQHVLSWTLGGASALWRPLLEPVRRARGSSFRGSFHLTGEVLRRGLFKGGDGGWGGEAVEKNC
jgi:hypothetical protein